VRELFVTPHAARRDVELLRRAAVDDVPVTLVTDRVITALGETVTPQGVVAVVGTPHSRLDEVLRRRPKLVVALVDVADPGNAGAVIRTADAAGADAVVLTRGSVDPFNGKCVRASAGSIFHVPVVTGVSAPDALSLGSAAGLQTLAAVVGDGDSLDDLDDDVLSRPTLWVFGSEAHGLDDAVAGAADRRVRVPIHGRAESLNLAAAVAVCLYASARAHHRSVRS
jgi:TrmH family RNA methyltransferase